MADKILELLKAHSGYKEKMSAAKEYSRQFTWHKAAEKTKELYTRVSEL
jgi:glycosyltransferase involved in cell wall biosynthesis